MTTIQEMIADTPIAASFPQVLRMNDPQSNAGISASAPGVGNLPIKAILDSFPTATYICDCEGRITYYNALAAQVWGRTPRLDNPADRYCASSKLFTSDGAPVRPDECWMALTLRHSKPFLGRELVVEQPNGQRLTMLAHANPLYNEAGALIGAVNVLVDITERKRMELAREQAEAALAESEERFRQVMETIEEVFWLSRADLSEVLYVSPAFEKVWGIPCARLLAAPRSWMDAIHPDDRPRVVDAVHDRMARGNYCEQYRIIRPDGSTRWIRDRGYPIRDTQGRVIRVCGVAEDITERMEMQEQLRQAQKMEAIGQLAGGVAHDFNNLLTIINGYSELLLERFRPDDPSRIPLEEVRNAGERAAALTRQLLAFSRKQILSPEILNLNDLVANAEKMLRRLIGEDIELVVRKAPDLYAARVDPGQIEQTLLNLAVNARDAMPQGGQLTIETANVALDESQAALRREIKPGLYVMLTMTDTGCGMDSATQARIFEPFFTTKEVGKGTGLGLATVYGIVKQSGGYIYVASAPGRGTTFTIYLPRVANAIDALKPAASAPQGLNGNERVLLVEDDENVRATTKYALLAHGYSVLEASSGADALRILEQTRDAIHLVITDVVMPGMSGPALAAQAAGIRPQTQFLFVSGYTDDAVVRSGVLSASMSFLQKPFAPGVLLRKVREVLERAKGTH